MQTQKAQHEKLDRLVNADNAQGVVDLARETVDQGGVTQPAVSADLQPGYYSVVPDRMLKLDSSSDGYEMPEGH